MAGLGVERIAFLFIQHGAQDVGRNVDGLSRSLFRLQGISDQLGGTSNFLSKFGEMVSSFGQAATKMTTMATGAVLGTSAMARFGIDVAKTGGHMIATRQQFDNTARTMGGMAEDLLPRLREGMLGAVSDMDIMRLSNFALSAGLKVSAADFARLAEASTKLAIIHGRDAPEALQRLTFGIIKQERRILDELGIVIKAKDVFGDYARSIGKVANDLTAAERVQAFFNATLSAAETQTKSFTGVNFSLAAVGDRMSASFQNFGQKLAQMFVEGGHAERLFKAMDNVLGSILTRLSQPGQAEAFFGGLINAGVALVQMTEKILNLLIAIAPYAERILKAFTGMMVGGAVGNILGSLASFIPGVGPIVGTAIKLAGPVIGAGAGLLSGSSATPRNVADEVSSAISPRMERTEAQVAELGDILRNQMAQGAPSYVPVA